MAELLAGWLEPLGCSWEWVDEPDGPGRSMVVRMAGDGARAVALLGHTDTVFPIGTVAERPFRREGMRCFGPGVADMKGGLVLAAMAMEAFATRPRPFSELRFLICADEEVRLRAPAVCAHAAGRGGRAGVRVRPRERRRRHRPQGRDLADDGAARTSRPRRRRHRPRPQRRLRAGARDRAHRVAGRRQAGHDLGGDDGAGRQLARTRCPARRRRRSTSAPATRPTSTSRWSSSPPAAPTTESRSRSSIAAPGRRCRARRGLAEAALRHAAELGLTAGRAALGRRIGRLLDGCRRSADAGRPRPGGRARPHGRGVDRAGDAGAPGGAGGAAGGGGVGALSPTWSDLIVDVDRDVPAAAEWDVRTGGHRRHPRLQRLRELKCRPQRVRVALARGEVGQPEVLADELEHRGEVVGGVIDARFAQGEMTSMGTRGPGP